MKRFLKIAIPLLILTAGLLVGCHFLFIRSHTITFESNGGTPVDSLTLRFGTPMSAPAEPTKEGEIFCGWYQDAELTRYYDFVFMGASDLVLYAAWSSPGLAFALNGNQTGYVVSLGDARATGRVVIPAEHEGLPVTAVAENGFRDHSTLEEVYLPDTVETIGTYAFYSCQRLSFIRLSASLRTIGPRAFEGCEALLSPDFPASLRTVSGYAFADCVALDSLVFPEGLETIAEFAFQGCSGIAEIVLPGSLQSIGRSAFSGCWGLVDLTLPFIGESRTATAVRGNLGFIFGVTEYAGSSRIVQYYSAEQTTAYYVPNSLQHLILTEGETLPFGAFSACISLVSVLLPEELTTVPGFAFFNCYFVSDLVLPAGVTAIGDYAFYGCLTLSGQPLPASLSTLGTYAFAECTGLVSVFLPASLETMGKDAFSLCTAVSFRSAALEQPASWDAGWNPAERPVTWGALE